MKFDLAVGELRLDSLTPTDVETRMRAALDEYRRHIRAVNMTLTTVAREARCARRRCRCVVHLKRMPPIIVQAEDPHLPGLLDTVAHAAAASLRQRLSAWQTGFRTRTAPSLADGCEPQP